MSQVASTSDAVAGYPANRLGVTLPNWEILAIVVGPDLLYDFTSDEESFASVRDIAWQY